MNEGDTRFLLIGAEHLQPGEMMSVTTGGLCILVANVAGELLAIDDNCSHEDAPLSLGALENDRVRCPLHGSRFCLRTGKPLEEPANEPVVAYAVSREGSKIFAVRKT